MVISRQNNASTDRRRSARWNVASRIFYHLDNDTTIHETLSFDISEAGICFDTHQLLKQNTKVYMKIFLSDREVIRVDGRIVRSVAKNGRYQAAVSFSDISAENQDKIIAYAFDRSLEDSNKPWFRGKK